MTTPHTRGLEAAARAMVACDPYSPPFDELPAARQDAIRLQAAAAVAAYAATLTHRPPGAVLFERTVEALASPARLPGDAQGGTA